MRPVSGTALPAGLATVIGLLVLWPDGEPTRAEQVAATYLPPGTTYPDGRVVSVEKFDCGDPGLPATCARAVVEGDGAGDFQQIDLDAVVVANGVEEGDTLVLTRDAATEGGATYGFFDFARGAPIITLAIAFAVVVSLVGAAAIMFVVLYLAHGFSARTTTRWSAPCSGSHWSPSSGHWPCRPPTSPD